MDLTFWLQQNTWVAIWAALAATVILASLDLWFVLYRFYWQMIGRLPSEQRAALFRGLREFAEGQLNSEKVRRR